ncbi:MAG: hypothetical protein WBE18_00565 [Gammaproteobacteria bacterium]
MPDSDNNFQSFLGDLHEPILILVLDEFMPRGYDALKPRAYHTINQARSVHKRFQQIIDHPRLLWKTQLKRIVDALGLGEIEEKVYLQGFTNNPKQLAQAIIQFNYPEIVKFFYSSPDVFKKNDNPSVDSIIADLARYARKETIMNWLSSPSPNPILYHIACIGYADPNNIFISQIKSRKNFLMIFQNFYIKKLFNYYLQNTKHLNSAIPSLALEYFAYKNRSISYLNYDGNIVFLMGKLKRNMDQTNEKRIISLGKRINESIKECGIDSDLFKVLSISWLVHWPNAHKFEELINRKPSFLHALQNNRLNGLTGPSIRNDLAYWLHSPYGNEVIHYIEHSTVSLDVMVEAIQERYFDVLINFEKFPAAFNQEILEKKAQPTKLSMVWKILKKHWFLMEENVITFKKLYQLPYYKLYILAKTNIGIWEQKVLQEFLSSNTKWNSRLHSYSITENLTEEFLTILDVNTTSKQIMDLFRKDNESFITTLYWMHFTAEEYVLIYKQRELAKQVIESPRFKLLLSSREGEKKYFLEQLGLVDILTMNAPRQSSIPPTRLSIQNFFTQLAGTKRNLEEPSAILPPLKMSKCDPNSNNAAPPEAIYEQVEFAKRARTTGNNGEELHHLEQAHDRIASYLKESLKPDMPMLPTRNFFPQHSGTKQNLEEPSAIQPATKMPKCDPNNNNTAPTEAIYEQLEFAKEARFARNIAQELHHLMHANDLIKSYLKESSEKPNWSV